MMTEEAQQVSARKRRSSGTSAATRITTAGLAIAVTLGLGGAVTARAAEQKLAEAKQMNAEDQAGPVAGQGVAPQTDKIKADERARYDARVLALRAKYRKSLKDLAAKYNAALNGSQSSGSASRGSSSSSTGSFTSSRGTPAASSSGSGSGSSSSSSSGSSTGSSGSSSSSGNSNNNSSSQGSVSAPKAPATSKGS